MQNDVCAEPDTLRSFSHSSAESFSPCSQENPFFKKECYTSVMPHDMRCSLGANLGLIFGRHECARPLRTDIKVQLWKCKKKKKTEENKKRLYS